MNFLFSLVCASVDSSGHRASLMQIIYVKGYLQLAQWPNPVVTVSAEMLLNVFID